MFTKTTIVQLEKSIVSHTIEQLAHMIMRSYRYHTIYRIDGNVGGFQFVLTIINSQTINNKVALTFVGGSKATNASVTLQFAEYTETSKITKALIKLFGKICK